MSEEQRSAPQDETTRPQGRAPRILCYSPYGSTPGVATAESWLLDGLEARGSETRHVLCDGLFETCDLYTAGQERDATACTRCQAAVAVLAHQANRSFEWLGRYLLPEEQRRSRAWASSLEDGELRHARRGSWELARWVRRSVRRHLDARAPMDSTEGAKAWRSYLETGLRAAFALDRLLDDYRPDALLVFEGTTSSIRVARELAVAAGVRVLSFQVQQQGELELVLHEQGVGPDQAQRWLVPGPSQATAGTELTDQAEAARALDLACSIIAGAVGDAGTSLATAVAAQPTVPTLANGSQARRPDAHEDVDTSGRDATPWPVGTDVPMRFLAWPDYQSDGELEVLMAEYGRHLVGRGDARLCLRLDPELDPGYDEVVSRLQAAHARVLGSNTDLDLLILDEKIPEPHLPRLGKAMTALLWLGVPATGARGAKLGRMKLRRFDSGDALLEALPPQVASAPLPAEPTDLPPVEGSSFWSPQHESSPAIV